MTVSFTTTRSKIAAGVPVSLYTCPHAVRCGAAWCGTCERVSGFACMRAVRAGRVGCAVRASVHAGRAVRGGAGRAGRARCGAMSAG
jgi:hypothetical protein